MTVDVPPRESDEAKAQPGASVVLMREGAAGCPLLLKALSARGLPPVVVGDEPAAMVALAELARRGVARRALVLVEPSRWDRLGELMAAVGSYYESVHCWRFDAAGGATVRLTRYVGAADPHQEHEAALGPVGQIRKRSRPVDRLLVPVPGEELSTRAVVTQQELTMLLGPAPGEAG